jgi:hypothetical protein
MDQSECSAIVFLNQHNDLSMPPFSFTLPNQARVLQFPSGNAFAITSLLHLPTCESTKRQGVKNSALFYSSGEQILTELVQMRPHTLEALNGRISD